MSGQVGSFSLSSSLSLHLYLVTSLSLWLSVSFMHNIVSKTPSTLQEALVRKGLDLYLSPHQDVRSLIFWDSDMWENEFLLFDPFNLWFFIMAP